jgi:hypothetical protein
MIGSLRNINGSSREKGIATLAIKVANHRKYPATAERFYESTKIAAVAQYMYAASKKNCCQSGQSQENIWYP